MSNYTLISPNVKPFLFEVFFKDLIKISSHSRIQLNSILLGVNKNIDFSTDQTLTFSLDRTNIFPDVKYSDFTDYNPADQIVTIRKGQYTFSELQSQLQSAFNSFIGSFTMVSYEAFKTSQFDIDPTRENDIVLSLATSFDDDTNPNYIRNPLNPIRSANAAATGNDYFLKTGATATYDSYTVINEKYNPFIIRTEQVDRNGYISTAPTGSYNGSDGGKTLGLYSLNYADATDLVPGLDPTRFQPQVGSGVKLVNDNDGDQCVANFISLEWTDSTHSKPNSFIIRQAVNDDGVEFQNWTNIAQNIASMKILYEGDQAENFFANGFDVGSISDILSYGVFFGLRTSKSEALLPIDEQFFYIDFINGLSKNLYENRWSIYDSKAVGNFKLPLSMLKGLPAYDSENRVLSQNPFNACLFVETSGQGFEYIRLLTFPEDSGTAAEPAVVTTKYTISPSSELATVLGKNSFSKNPNFGFPTESSILREQLIRRGDSNPNYIIRDLQGLYINKNYTVSIENLPIQNRKNNNNGDSNIIFSSGVQKPVLSNIYFPFKDGITIKDTINNKEQIQGLYRPYYPIVTDLNNSSPLDLNSFQISIRDLESHNLSEEITKVVLDFTIL
jgi:hypothetical protein